MISQPMKVLTVMMTGKPVTIEEFKATLGNQVAMDKLSMHIWKLKGMGAKIQAHKQGKRVTAYQLLNADEMAAYRAENAKPKAMPAYPAKKITFPAKIGGKVGLVEANEDGEIPSWVDPDFDETDLSDFGFDTTGE